MKAQLGRKAALSRCRASGVLCCLLLSRRVWVESSLRCSVWLVPASKCHTSLLWMFMVVTWAGISMSGDPTGTDVTWGDSHILCQHAPILRQQALLRDSQDQGLACL